MDLAYLHVGLSEVPNVKTRNTWSMGRIAILLATAAGILAAQGTTPKKAAAEYPVQVQFDDFELGAEYMVRSFGNSDQLLLTEDYLTVEVAVFPVHHRAVPVHMTHFALRINGNSTPLLPEPAGFVAAAIKYPDWNRRSNVTIGAGPIQIGGTPQVERFPGDRRSTQDRLPRPPQAPSSRPVDQPEPQDMQELLSRISLPEGETKLPVSGYLFFAYRGKLKSVKKVELLVGQGSAQKVISLK